MAKKEKVLKQEKDSFDFEDTTGSLTDKQKLFCMMYVGECKFNGSQSAIKAGYSENTSMEQSSRLLTNVKIKNYIEDLKNDLGIRIGVTAEMIANEYKKIAFSNIKDILTVDGGLKDISQMDDSVVAGIASIETNELTNSEGERIGTNRKITMHNKLKGLDSISKMLGYDGVTKVASTNTKGEDVVAPPDKDSTEKLALVLSKLIN